MTGPRRVRLDAELHRQRPDLEDAACDIHDGRVLVNGVVMTNPASRVALGSTIVVARETALRGEAKLGGALDQLRVAVAGRIALDVGAAAGGFTKALLGRGAAEVYAVDVGHGQLLGSLRQDPRVVNLEATNVSALNTALVPEPVDVITVDVSYLSLTDAVAQLRDVAFAAGVDLVGLVKPMFELAAASLPTDPAHLARARDLAVAGVTRSGWRVIAAIESPVRGSKGAFEWFVHARRSP